MKTLSEIREDLNLEIKETASRINYFNIQNLDYDAYIPSRGFNLQRNFVWNHLQKSELIMSILIQRHIPHLSIYVDKEDKWIIIDGKQRLSSILAFNNNEYTIAIEGVMYFFKDLPQEYQDALSKSTLRYYICYENMTDTVEESDIKKINWFKFINFAGTRQDVEHLNKLK